MSIDKETLGAYQKSAKTYQNLVSTAAPDSDLQRFLDLCSSGDSVLDFGCGPGNSAAMMKAAGLNVTALDASSEMVALAKEAYGIDAICADFTWLSQSNLFDAIWANFSLLHVPKADFPSHLDAIKHALKPSGLFHIGMKIGDGEERDKLGRFYSYYEQDELIDLLETAGFDVSFQRLGEGKGLAGDVSPFIIVNAYA